VVVKKIQVADIVGDLGVPVLAGHPGTADPGIRPVTPRGIAHVEAVQRLRRRHEPVWSGDPAETPDEPGRELAITVEDDPE
jgi:hypothetical protein